MMNSLVKRMGQGIETRMGNLSPGRRRGSAREDSKRADRGTNKEERLQKALRLAWRRIAIVGSLASALLLYALWDKQGAEVVLGSLADAYVSVTAFVAATLILLLMVEQISGFDAARFMGESKRWELPMASFLGALPGCGGALVVVTQYVKGKLSFGALIAVLTATMGDAAFLILAKKPLIGLILIASTFTVGWISGMVVNALHGEDFMRRKDMDKRGGKDESDVIAETGEHGCRMLFSGSKWRGWVDGLWFVLLVPGIVGSVLYAFQVDVLSLHFWGLSSAVVFAIFTILCVVSWVLFSGPTGRETRERKTQSVTWRSIIDDTNFVTAWVVAAFLVFDLTIHVFALDLQSMFGAAYIFLPLIAIVVGFIPGCGPQILVAATYISGLMPFSALMGNAISNDGDALFPALALVPGAAVVATLYSAVPALVVSYVLLFFGY